MNIILVGYGKMGKTIERIARGRGHEITGRIDIDNQADLDTMQGDVAIEFSHPSAAFNNVKRCLERGVPVVCGTTGWLDHKPAIEKLCSERGGAFFYASNYSLGVNVFFRLNKILAGIMNNFPDYDVAMEEIHHTEKKDAPSGTAITLAEGVLQHFTRKKSWVNSPANDAGSLYIESKRIGQTPGTHTVKYTSATDDIEIRHTAHTREGFALGALLVAEWLKGRQGVLGMDDFLKF